MTDPTGPIFISYKHSQQELAEALDLSLCDHGVPIWRDVHDVGPDPLQQQIIEDLKNPDLAGGVVLVSEDVVDSEIILQVELPGLYERWQDDDDFFVVVVLPPNLRHDDGEQILSASPSPYDFSQWYMESLQVGSDPDRLPVTDDAVAAVLEKRLQRIDETLDSEKSIECSLDTYDRPSYTDPLAMKIDWSPHFNEDLPTAPVWNSRLLPALKSVVDRIQQAAPGRPLRFRGRAHLPAAFAVGHTLQTTRNIDAAWMQADSTGGFTPWTINRETEESDLQTTVEKGDVAASHLAVFVNVAGDVTPEVGQTKSRLPDFNGIVELSPKGKNRLELTAAQAVHAATMFQDELRTATNDLPNTSVIHLFMAVPAGLAFLFGQQTNTLPPIQTYLLDTKHGGRTYQPAVRLQ